MCIGWAVAGFVNLPSSLKEKLLGREALHSLEYSRT
eukprot:SAG22_NODE_15428_length_349_cov_0.620000_1_plen_35_part_10